jgi:putative endonuclease
MSHFVYILECADKTLYTGYTTDIARRVVEHNEAKVGAKYTRGRRPVRLVYSEKFSTRGEALSREADIKKLTRMEKIELF